MNLHERTLSVLACRVSAGGQVAGPVAPPSKAGAASPQDPPRGTGVWGFTMLPLSPYPAAW